MKNKPTSRTLHVLMFISSMMMILLLCLAYQHIFATNDSKNEPGTKVSKHIQADLVQTEKANLLKDSANFKSWMDYRTITSKTSPQYTLQQGAYTGPHGIRYYAGCPMIAIGTGWGASVGDFVIVVLDNNTTFGCIVGDIKSDIHTDDAHLFDLVNGSVIEFIVDADLIPDCVRITGSFSSINVYESRVIDIYQEVLYER